MAMSNGRATPYGKQSEHLQQHGECDENLLKLCALRAVSNLPTAQL
jgi:hypothetical protein